MASQQDEHTQDTRQRLMESALLVFAEKGFDGAGIREIAQNAQANPAMIAYYFGSKEGLHEAALQWFASKFFMSFKMCCSLPDPGLPNAKSIALAALKVHLKELFENLFGYGSNNNSIQAREVLHRAAHKLWTQEMEDPRSSLLDFIIEQVRISSDHLISCISILRPDLSKFELEAMAVSIRGPILFFFKNFNVIQKMRGENYSGGDLKRLSQHFVDFSLRGLGCPDDFVEEGA
jgi:AcrR family transcriptional regulator